MQQRRGAQVGQRARLIEHRVADVVTVRVTAARDAIVRARFDRTVWDSNGDSRMKTIVRPRLLPNLLPRDGQGDAHDIVRAVIGTQVPAPQA